MSPRELRDDTKLLNMLIGVFPLHKDECSLILPYMDEMAYVNVLVSILGIEKTVSYIEENGVYGKEALKLLLSQPFTTLDQILGYITQSRSKKAMTATQVDAFFGKDPEILRLLEGKTTLKAMNSKVDRAGARWTYLHEACKKGSPSAVQILIKAGADINAQDVTGKTPLHATLSRVPPARNIRGTEQDPQFQIAKILVSLGADITLQDAKGLSAIAVAVSKGVTLVIEHAVENVAAFRLDEPDHRGYTPLLLCARSGRVHQMKLLIQAGADISFRETEKGNQAIHLCAMSGMNAMARCLLESGSGFNSANNDGQTPLMLAVLHDNVGVIRVLLSESQRRGEAVDLDAKDLEGKTALHHSVVLLGSRVRSTALELLLEAGSGINVQDSSGNTPLHYAAMKDKLLAIELLLEKGADVSVKNSKGLSPKDFDVVQMFIPEDTDA